MNCPMCLNTRTLYVIGNGFDLHHNINSKFADFQKYLFANNQMHLAGDLETFYPLEIEHEDSKWGNFEEALGHIDYEQTYEECNELNEIDYDHMMSSAAILEDTPKTMLEDTLFNMRLQFRKWVDSIEISTEKDNEIDNFLPSDLFLNFNYTETLEDIYKIPRTSICYIHGRRKSSKELILGHYHITNLNELQSDGLMVHEYDAYKHIIEIANEEKKDVDAIIGSNASFWLLIKGINRVVTYGHSFSIVDMKYFEKLRKSISEDAKWYLSYHSCEDKKKAISCAARLSLDKSHYSCFKF